MITFFINSIFCKYNTNNTINNINNKLVCAYLGEPANNYENFLYIL
jgi:hypothetical protein